MNSASLAKELKNKLMITWNDQDVETRILSIIEDAKIALDFKLGIDYDYSISGMEHSLFLNYCMYSYNNCLNEFDKNYLSELLLIRNKHAVRKSLYEKK